MKMSTLSPQVSQPRMSFALAAALIVATSGACYGQIIVNPNFAGSGTGGFSPGWTTTGDASVQGPTFNGGSIPPSGYPFEGVITTIIPLDSPPVSGVSAVTASVLESFLGLVPNTLNLPLSQYPGDHAEEGSAFKQTFTAQAGDTFTFRWNFYTAEALVSPAGHDYAFMTLQQGTSSASLTTLVLANSTTGLHTAPGGLLSDFSSETGYRSSSTVTIPSSGTWTLGFGVVDDSYNPGTDSALAITGIVYTPVPEPWAASSVAGLVLGAWAFYARRSRNSRA